MPSVQVKNVPPDTHAVLRRRAAGSGQSLQEYLRSLLIDEAARPTMDEVLDRASRRVDGGVSFAAAIETLRHDRASH